MRALVRLYPAWWRRRYGAEMEMLLDDLGPASRRRRLTNVVDLLRGAAHAHLTGPARSPARMALRQAVLIALLVWAALSVEIVVSNVAFPHVVDDDGTSVLICYLAVFGALGVTGRLAVRTSPDRRIVAAAGAAAGALIGALTILTYVVIDNAFLGIIGRQQAKIDGLATSGVESMRTYVNVSLLLGFAVLTGFLAVTGAGLALLGGLTRGIPHRRSA
jgi:hypothetical protein